LGVPFAFLYDWAKTAPSKSMENHGLLRPARTRGQILTTYNPYDVLLHKEAPFGVALMLLSLSGCNNPKPRFRGREDAFQTQHAQYYNLHVVETTAPNPAKFCTLTSASKYSSWAVQTRVSKMADGCHSKTVKSPHLSNGLTDRHEI